MRRESKYGSGRYNYNAASSCVQQSSRPNAIDCSDTISVYQLQRLAEHKYSAAGKSILERPMNVFWTWAIEKVPLSVAPNTITLVGLICNILTTLILVWFSPDGKREVPPWALVACALGLFIYQTLDAIDGKQARRTNSSSPLGELFDHGCDAVSVVFVALGLCIAMGMGTHPQVMFYSCSMATFLFYCAHWQSYVSGVFRANTVDVTEGQMCAIAIYITTAIFGVHFWDTVIPPFGVALKLLPVLFTTVLGILASSSYFTSILTGGIGKNGATCADTSVISPAIPIGLVLVGSVYISQSSQCALMETHPCLYNMMTGMLGAKVTNVLVVAQMSRSEMGMFDSCLYAPLVQVINLWLGVIMPELWLLWIAFVYSVWDLMYYSVTVCRAICHYLGISCFRVSVFQPAAATAAPTAPSTSGGYTRNGRGTNYYQ